MPRQAIGCHPDFYTPESEKWFSKQPETQQKPAFSRPAA
jgi:hypothetical protein